MIEGTKGGENMQPMDEIYQKYARRVILGISLIIIVVAAAIWVGKDCVFGTLVSSE